MVPLAALPGAAWENWLPEESVSWAVMQAGHQTRGPASNATRTAMSPKTREMSKEDKVEVEETQKGRI